VLTALTLIESYATRTGEPLRLLEAWGEASEDRIWVQWPAWIIELAQHYQALYGEAGAPILQRVLRQLLPLESLH